MLKQNHPSLFSRKKLTLKEKNTIIISNKKIPADNKNNYVKQKNF